jgi:hypothetical protein
MIASHEANKKKDKTMIANTRVVIILAVFGMVVSCTDFASGAERGGRSNRTVENRKSKELKEKDQEKTQEAKAKAEELKAQAEKKAAEAKEKAANQVSEEQKKNIAKLKEDAAAEKAESTVTDEQKASFKTELKTALSGTQKPDPATTEALATDLSNAMQDGKLSKKEIKALQQDVNKVLNSANITDEEIAALKASSKEILAASNLTQDEINKLVNDVAAIAQTAQKNAEAKAAQ